MLVSRIQVRRYDQSSKIPFIWRRARRCYFLLYSTLFNTFCEYYVEKHLLSIRSNKKKSFISLKTKHNSKLLKYFEYFYSLSSSNTDHINSLYIHTEGFIIVYRGFHNRTRRPILTLVFTKIDVTTRLIRFHILCYDILISNYLRWVYDNIHIHIYIYAICFSLIY